jgi:hypothetical protein
MNRFAVTIYEQRSYMIVIKAETEAEARVKAIKTFETLGPFQPDTVSLDPAECEVENMDTRLVQNDPVGGV